MMRSLWTLYRKEIAGAKSNALLAAATIFLWEVFLATRQGKWQPELVFGLSTLPYFLLPVWALISGMQSLRREWNENSSYVLLSLPTRGWTIVGAKVLALLTELTLHVILVPCLVLLLLKPSVQAVLLDPAAVSMLAQVGAYAAGLYWLLLAIATVVGQFCYLVSAIFDRFQWAATGWVVVLSAYILTRGANIVSPLFAWLPDLPVRTYNQINGVTFRGTAAIETSALAATIVLAALMFVTVSLLMERSVEA